MNLIAIDWGTSSLRGALLDPEGKVLEEQNHSRGILTVPPGEFASVFDSLFGEWMRPRGSRCLISGMAGSKQGWIEAPYCTCPAGRAEVGKKIVDIESNAERTISMVPGLSDEHDGVPDVMRGEEVQIFGAMALTGRDEGIFVLPGTHNKWVIVRKGRVAGFRTFMTGEFYALLSQHSILARMLDVTAPLDEASFLQGVTQTDNGQGLLHNAFGARSLPLFDRMPKAEVASYLSGLLIGEELRTQSLHGVGEVVLIGMPALTDRYALALRTIGVATHTLGAEATWAGLHALSAYQKTTD